MGAYGDGEIPLLVMLFYLFRDVETSLECADSSVKPSHCG